MPGRSHLSAFAIALEAMAHQWRPGDSYGHALAEIIGRFKTEVINRLGPWKPKDQVEWETLQWINWFNNEHISALGRAVPESW